MILSGLFHVVLGFVFWIFGLFFFNQTNHIEPVWCTTPYVDMFPPLHRWGVVKDEGKPSL